LSPEESLEKVDAGFGVNMEMNEGEEGVDGSFGRSLKCGVEVLIGEDFGRNLKS
jgi:hypothetical protein